jgi:hypothetical protein
VYETFMPGGATQTLKLIYISSDGIYNGESLVYDQ